VQYILKRTKNNKTVNTCNKNQDIKLNRKDSLFPGGGGKPRFMGLQLYHAKFLTGKKPVVLCTGF
jgi:hypothetical protein